MSKTSLAKIDSQVDRLIKKEVLRHNEGLGLIASENYPSLAVRQAVGSVLSARYAQGGHLSHGRINLINSDKKFIPIIILSLLFGGIVFAQDDALVDPGMTPDSPFYFLEIITEKYVFNS